MKLAPCVKKIIMCTVALVLAFTFVLTYGADVMQVSAATYSVGSSGSGVVSLHEKLITLGYMGANTSSKYSATTKASVIKFQKAYALAADGI
ncbi:MAG: peptidoglycan-binding protein, partial [Clostridia bacterium]|nr:peptidoglycan-binding protein [Clostridia bacterium]